MGLLKEAGKFLFGSPEKHKQVSTLRPEQEALYQQLQNSAMNKGAGGAFGDAADYYRSNLSNNPEDFNAFAAPELRRFNEDIIPQLSEQFAGMGSGGLDSSSFRNAAVGAGTDLSERLAAIRANLRQSSAAGLQGIGQNALQNFSQDRMTQAGSEGILPGIATAAGSAIGGPVGGAIANSAGNWLSQSIKGKSNPYGGSALQGAGAQAQRQSYVGAR
jgi:hypothetical protein